MCYVGQPVVSGRPSRAIIFVQFIWYERPWYQYFLFNTNSGQQALCGASVLAMIGIFVLVPPVSATKKDLLGCHKISSYLLYLTLLFSCPDTIKIRNRVLNKEFSGKSFVAEHLSVDFIGLKRVYHEYLVMQVFQLSCWSQSVPRLEFPMELMM